ncbi:single-stranded-DNA-specific exonuclease RecJ [Alicyclobacillus fodiniaquatilis]|uniref:Single-stranded-DNA-specific exonuclease RecJ n=1 Tax=Alicyclobacillus fodiniaquatilis TaxID=1661150 RepID=A0ABW4JMS7_9BACL
MTKVPLWSTAGASDHAVEALVETLALPRRVASWLVARKITDPQEARRFLFAHERFSDPFAFHEMKPAIHRLIQAMEQDEIIVIVGDYDVDGVTASTILASELVLRGATWHCLIPDRVADGYGLSEHLVDSAAALGAHLIITVDNGIRADSAVASAVAQGIDVIVTDHHEPGDTALPPCTAVVHWARHDMPNEAIVLSGAGVAWKFCQALQTMSPLQGNAAVLDDHANWQLGLASLGAISDMMPMRGENRRLIREGLEAMRQCQRPGWRTLCLNARVKPEELSVTGVSWRIAPRMNAAGRMTTAKVAFDLLMADNLQNATDYADTIEALNTERRQVTERAVQEAIAEVEEAYGGQPDSVVVRGRWPLGVVGIVAAKLVDTYDCPAIVFADAGESLLRGSGRAPAGFSLYDALSECAVWLAHFGGHDAAVGCGVESDNFLQFRAAFDNVVRQADIDTSETASMVADDFLPLADANLELLDWALRFAPYGPENEPLRFFIGPAVVTRVMPLGNGAHVRLCLREGQAEAEAVWFNAPEVAREMGRVGQLIGLLVELEENVWQGVRKAQLRVLAGWHLQEPIVRDVFARFYRLLQKRRQVPETMFRELAEAHGVHDVEVILATFRELGFAACRDGAYHVLEAVKSRDLREAISYQAHLREHLVALT